MAWPMDVEPDGVWCAIQNDPRVARSNGIRMDSTFHRLSGEGCWERVVVNSDSILGKFIYINEGDAHGPPPIPLLSMNRNERTV
jgi:hypothetical protein